MLLLTPAKQRNSQPVIGWAKKVCCHCTGPDQQPLIIMGDEPIGNLDRKNREIVFEIFKYLVEQHKHTLLIVTHDPSFAKGKHRVIKMENGTITGEHTDSK